MRKVYNFGAGPSMLPESVLLRAQAEMLDWHGTGCSIMEIGHRTQTFQTLIEKIEVDLRAVMAIPKNYHVLFAAGGATTQTAMIPLNLLATNNKADYVQTGRWSQKAFEEAQLYGDIHLAATEQERNGKLYIPSVETWSIRKDAAYLHYTPNETIVGLEFQWVPQIGDVPLVADMTSMILSRPTDVSQFGLIYAGAQKNAGQAGITLVIIRDDLVRNPHPHTPSLYRYQNMIKEHSVGNTPPTYAWYMAGLMFEWIKEQGGVDVLYARNLRKAAMLYDVIDTTNGFYVNKVEADCRSIMNVIFHLHDEALTRPFIDEAKQHGLEYLAGHKTYGGIRVSIYNAMPEEGVKLLANFMKDFAARRG